MQTTYMYYRSIGQNSEEITNTYTFTYVHIHIGIGIHTVYVQYVYVYLYVHLYIYVHVFLYLTVRILLPTIVHMYTHVQYIYVHNRHGSIPIISIVTIGHADHR
jgi:hypothetical protein